MHQIRGERVQIDSEGVSATGSAACFSTTAGTATRRRCPRCWKEQRWQQGRQMGIILINRTWALTNLAVLCELLTPVLILAQKKTCMPKVWRATLISERPRFSNCSPVDDSVAVSHQPTDAGQVTRTVTRVSAPQVTCLRLRACDVTGRASQLALASLCRRAYQSAWAVPWSGSVSMAPEENGTRRPCRLTWREALQWIRART